MKSYVCKLVFIIGIIIASISFSKIETNAATLLDKGTFSIMSEAEYLDIDEDDMDPEEDNYGYIPFTLKESGCVYLDMTISFPNCKTVNEKLVISLENDGKKIYQDTYGKKHFKNNQWDYSVNVVNYSNTVLKPGEYEFSFCNSGTHEMKISYKLYYSSGYAESISFKKSITLRAGQYTQLNRVTTPKDACMYASKVKIGNKNIVNCEAWNGDLYVYGLRPGKTYVKVRTLNGKMNTVRINVKNPKKPFFYSKKYTVPTGYKFTNILFGKKKIKWWSSNSNIAKVDSKGKVVAKRAGKCKIYAKTGGKTYKYKLVVVRRVPDFGAVLVDYDTRDNYFTVDFKNFSDKTMTIKSGSKVLEYDYKSFDRNIRLKKSVQIKPHKTKSVKFYVNGRTTWYDHESFWLYYKFIFDGKDYEGKTNSRNSEYKIKGKWTDTFWDERQYKDEMYLDLD